MVRSFDARDFPAGVVADVKRGRPVSVCLPARDEAATIGGIVESIRVELMERRPVVDELIVVDDGSSDATASIAAAAGARVVEAASVLADHAPGPGKGEAMWKALHESAGEFVVFCDADVREFDPAFVLGLVGPLLAHDDVAFVKGRYVRSFEGRSGEGGRVTELTARPLISLLHPDLAPLGQPLAGECAARRAVLEAVPFVGGYGVDLGLLIDVAARFGPAGLAQCDLGERLHRNRTLAELSAQAVAVAQVALERSGWRDGRGGLPWTAVLRRPDADAVPVTMSELPALRDLATQPMSA